jgi:TonB family protein
MHPGAPITAAPARVAPRSPPSTAATEAAVEQSLTANEGQPSESVAAESDVTSSEEAALPDSTGEQGNLDERADTDAREQLTLAIRLRERGMLLAPEDNNAFDYLRALAAQNPDLEGLSAERQRLAFSLLEHTRTALVAKQLDVAQSHLAAADDLLPGMAAAQSLREQLRLARAEHDFWKNIAQAGTLKALRPLQAEYPREARIRGIEGWVDVEFTIREDGATEDLVVRAAEPQALFDQSALEAIRRSRFEPVERDDVRVKQRALLRVKYELAN